MSTYEIACYYDIQCDIHVKHHHAIKIVAGYYDRHNSKMLGVNNYIDIIYNKYTIEINMRCVE